MAMNPVDAARSILKYFNSNLAITMLAIAYGESGLDSQNEGDSPQSLRNLGYSFSTQQTYRNWNCPVYGKTTDDTAGCSIGLLQINIVPNHDVVMRLSGISFHTYDAGLQADIPVNKNDACLLVTWLKNPDNNAHAARAIYDSQGLNAWTIYKNGTYKNYLSAATNAVNQALATQPTPSPAPTPTPTPTPTPFPSPFPSPETPFTITFAGLLYVAALGGATAIISYKIIKRKQK